ncbi:MAG: hypothetical protein AAFV88_21360 [Planctomycetota bacterium]
MNYRYLFPIVVIFVCTLGCGGDPAPEITEDVAAEIAAEDEEIVDAESEL